MTDQKQSNLPKTAAPAQRALQSAGIFTLKQLSKISKEELLQLHGMGPNALGKFRDSLKAKGLSWRPSISSASSRALIDGNSRATVSMRVAIGLLSRSNTEMNMS